MRALITGARGTVGRVLTRVLEARGFEVVPWDRSAVPIDRYDVMEDFVRDTAPDVLYHLAIASTVTGRAGEPWHVNYEWPSELAWICRHASVRFVFTSSAMVFSNDARGPFAIDHAPDASEGYGYEKRCAEERVFHQNPHATVVRLGWQIGHDLKGNQMRAWLAERAAADGGISASTRWLPACSFIDDAAEALWRLLVRPPGLYQLDSNTRWSFHDIASAIAAEHGWSVKPTDDFVYDQRLLDDRVHLPALDTRLPALSGSG